MIPTVDVCKKLFDQYHLPEKKRIHVEKVAQVAQVLADRFIEQGIAINRDLIIASALLHDIDKNIPRLSGEHHPDTGVRILNEQGFTEVANVVRTHSVHSIVSNDPPVSWEQKIVYLSDKMVKYECIGVEDRFKLWFDEDLPEEEIERLKVSLPHVLVLEQEIYSQAQIDFEEIQKKCV